MATYEFQDRNYELGGTLLHSSNLYMKQFVKYLGIFIIIQFLYQIAWSKITLYINIKGLEKREDDKDEFHGFYNADGLLLSLNGAYFGLFDKNRPPEKFDSSNILCYAIFDPRAPWGPQEIDLSLEGPDQNFEHII